ncbi:MAG TPA: phytanoyl-CoA dioxygenase family protein, partial [Stellaceae bacterium]|nr:phytanoyl-CoA dioxygenase family protein [Stellaceae bacterium]
MLSRQQIEQYRETGWLVVEGLLDPALLDQARQVIAQFVAGSARISAHDDVYDLEPGHRPDAPRVRRIKTPHKHHPLFRKIARDPVLVGILEQLLGPSGVRLHGSKINLKEPHYGAPVEWHQDWAFYPDTNDDVLAVGVMLDDMLPENGPLLVLPNSHRGPVYDHHLDGCFSGAIDPTTIALDFGKAVALTAPAGSMSFHHVR